MGDCKGGGVKKSTVIRGGVGVGVNKNISGTTILLPGLVIDGELNSLQKQGATRPLHLWHFIHGAQESAENAGSNWK